MTIAKSPSLTRSRTQHNLKLRQRRSGEFQQTAGHSLALYVDILERLDLSAGRRGFIWDIHGDEVSYDLLAPRSRKNPQTLWDKYQEALSQCRAILAKHVTPLAASSSACKLCHWHTFCIDQLTAANDLTLIPFLGRSVGLPQEAVPVSKLESGADSPASELAEAERKPG